MFIQQKTVKGETYCTDSDAAYILGPQLSCDFNELRQTAVNHASVSVDYYQAVETYRDDGKIRHRTVAYLGQHPDPAVAIKTRKRMIRTVQRKLNILAWARSADPDIDRRCVVLERRIAEHHEVVAKLQAVAKALASK